MLRLIFLFDGRKEVEVTDQSLSELERLRVVSVALALDHQEDEDEEEEAMSSMAMEEAGGLRFHSLRSFAFPKRCY